MTRKAQNGRPPSPATLLSVSPWRDLSTGEENGDVVIALDIREVLTRVRLSDADAQHLADAIPSIRAGIAARRRASVARRRAFSLDSESAELRAGQSSPAPSATVAAPD